LNVILKFTSLYIHSDVLKFALKIMNSK